MATQRYISTSFWDDEWIQTLDPSEKLLYLYLMTNPLTNIAGAYKITIRRMVFDTGFNDDTISRILAKFEKAGKAYHHQEYMILPSWPKHQKWEKKSTIKTGIDSELNTIPDEVKKYMISIGYRYPIEGYTYDPSYSDLHSDSDLDTDLHSDADAPVAPQSFVLPALNQNPENAKDGAARIELARALWNTKTPGIGPPCRLMVMTFKPEDTRDCLRVMTAYSDADILQAIENYAQIRASPEHEVKSPYQSFVGFIRGGVEKFVPDAKPFDAYRKTPPPWVKPERMGALDDRPDSWQPSDRQAFEDEAAQAMTPEEKKAAAEAWVREHPDSPVAKALSRMVG